VPEGARFCPSCGAAQDAPTDSGEERKVATVLFADLVGSTALAHNEDPERVRVRLDRYHSAMAEEIERTGGTVEMFAGDGVMAAFGAPSALEDHAERALHAGLAMQRRLQELFGGELELRVGVNTGDVVVGQPREGGPLVTGDAVNVGARLEQAAAAGEVLAGERTVAVARGAFEFGESRVVDAKGKPGGVVGYPALRALTLARPRGFAGFRRAFVGREREVDLLLATVRRAFEQREPHLVTIVGEPGVGKTTLVRELWERLSQEEVVPLRRTGRCLPYGDGITYWPLGEVLREHYALLEGESPVEIRSRLAGQEFLALALGLDVGAGLHPLDARERLHQAAVGFVESIAAEQPAVVLFEDVHWAEDDFLDLLERIVREARAPVAVVATARPELLDRRSTWGGGRRNATAIWLEPLQEEDALRMVDELLAVELPGDLRRLLAERSEGNPFFVEELLGELVDAGVIERVDESWTSRELPEGFLVPDSVQAVLAARMDRLPPLEKSALQAAAVIGRVFWPSAVVHLTGDEPDLELLEERDFIRRRAGSSLASQREYAVKHALTREVAYASIPKARRGRLHAALADWLVALELADEHVGLLAYHYAEAVRPEDADLVWADDAEEHARRRQEAVRWLRRAGGLASGRYEMEEAVELLGRAVELADDPAIRAALWIEIGHVQALRYDGEAFWDAMLRGIELGALDRAAEADAYASLAFQTAIRSGMWLQRPDLAPLPGWIEKAIELSAPDSSARAQALLARSISTVSEEDAIAASALADDLGDVELRSFAFGARAGAAAVQRGAWDEASTLSENRLQLAAGIEDLDHRCEVFESAIPLAVALGRFREARRLAGLHAEASARLSPHHRLHSAALRVEIAENIADWGDARAQTDSVVEAVERNADTPCVRNARSLIACGLGHVVAGDERTAGELLARAGAFSGEGWGTYLNPLLLRFALVRGDRGEAERLVGSVFEREYVFGPSVKAVRLDALAALGHEEAVEAEAPVSLRKRTFIEPFALRALGIVRRDDDLLRQADERFAELGLDWHAAQTERLLAGL
jgi:class 3 adenylate cyclase